MHPEKPGNKHFSSFGQLWVIQSVFSVTVAQLLNDLHEKLSVMAKEGEWIVQGLLISCLPTNWKSLGGRLIATWRGANDGI